MHEQSSVYLTNAMNLSCHDLFIQVESFKSGKIMELLHKSNMARFKRLLLEMTSCIERVLFVSGVRLYASLDVF